MAKILIKNMRTHDIDLRSRNHTETIPAGTDSPAGFAPGTKIVDSSFLEEAGEAPLVRGYFDHGWLRYEEMGGGSDAKAAAEAAAREAAEAAARAAAAEAASKAAEQNAQAQADADAKAAIRARAIADAGVTAEAFDALDEDDRNELLELAAADIAAEADEAAAKKDEGKPAKGKKK